MKRLLFLLALLMPVSCTVSSSSTPQEGHKVQRKPLQKSSVKLKAPIVYAKREKLNKRGKAVTYDPRPQFVAVDEKAGKYEVRWIGYDGKQKVIAYQRADAADLVVSVEAVKTGNGQYQYAYDLYNLPSSPAYVSTFIVQVFADIAPDLQLYELRKQNKLYIGEMSPDIKRFREGRWRTFHQLDEATHIQPGQHFTIRFTSTAPPGLVGCAAVAGEQTLKGAGEEMPFELESAMPGYDVYPSGQTIGPVASLAQMSREQTGQYLLERLAQFQDAGWMTEYARQTYEKLLQTGDYDILLTRLDKDLQKEQITSEVYSIVGLLKPD